MNIDEVRRLRERYEAVLDDAEAARAAYHAALKELYRSGAPLRDLAEQLGMSHQRVHQIVADKPPISKTASKRVAGAIGATILLAVAASTAVLWAERPTVDEGRPTVVEVDVLTRGQSWRFDYNRYGVSVSDRSPVIFLPAGAPVRFELRTSDVTHAIWIPGLAGKQEIIPGRPTRLEIRTGPPDRFWGVDAEFAGIDHELPRFSIRVVSPAEFERWIMEARTAASS